MRYLKKYKKFTENILNTELPIETLDIIKDSLVDLVDIGYNINNIQNFEGEFPSSDGTNEVKKAISINISKITPHQRGKATRGSIHIKYGFDKEKVKAKRINNSLVSPEDIKLITTTNDRDIIDIIDDCSHRIINMLDYTSGYFEYGVSNEYVGGVKNGIVIVLTK